MVFDVTVDLGGSIFTVFFEYTYVVGLALLATGEILVDNSELLVVKRV